VAEKEGRSGHLSGSLGPTSGRHFRLYSSFVLLAIATAHPAVLCPSKHLRASGEPRLRRSPARSSQEIEFQNFPESADSMIANALLITIALLLAYGFWLMGELKFMVPYKAAVFHAYGTWIFVSVAVLFFNAFGIVLLLLRKVLLKNTGRKLSHLDRQFQVGQIEMPAPATEERDS
jgi:hypothetical protein